jgi:hypothetical protein
MISEYKDIWLLLIDVTVAKDTKFAELVDFEEEDVVEYSGAWANVLVKAETAKLAFELAPKGLSEKGFIVKEIDTNENFGFLVEKDEVGEDVIAESDWLISSEYLFMLSGKLFPYIED